MAGHRLFAWFLALGAAATLSVFLIDGSAALALRPVAPSMRAALRPVLDVIELIFGFPLSIYASGVAVLLAAMLCAAVARLRTHARVLLFIALSQLTTRFAVDILKPVFNRLRPYQALADGTLHDRFFTDVGNSFPSGHAAHFWGFYFALAVLFPRYRLSLLIFPVLVSSARVVVNDHYIGDVVASAAVAALVTYMYSRVLPPRVDQSVRGVPPSALA